MEKSVAHLLVVAGDDGSGRLALLRDQHFALDCSLQELIIIMNRRPTEEERYQKEWAT